MDTSTPVIVLGLQRHFALSIARSLGRLGVDVYALHHDLGSPGGGTRYLREVFEWKVNARAPRASIDYLLSLARRLERSPILLASEEEGVTFIAENCEELGQVFRVACPPAALVSALTSKRDLHLLCEKHNVPTPASLGVPRSRAEVEAFASGATFPVVVKALVQWARYPRLRTAIAGDRQELLERYDRLQVGARPNVLLQQYIRGEDSNWMFNGYFDERSEPLAVFTGRALRGWPPGAGQATLGVCAGNQVVEGQATRFLKEVGYRGAVDMDFRYDASDGVYKLLDVNPRIGAAFRLFEDASGLDVARVLYLDLTGQPRRAGPGVEGKTWCLEDMDLAACRRGIRDGSLTPRGWLRSLRSVDETAWWARDDLWPFARGLVRWAWRRLGAAPAPLAPEDGPVPGALPADEAPRP